MPAPILPPDQVAEAARILRAGGLVGFPTDTVYGVAALADASFHSANLQTFKGGRNEPFSVHLPDVATALKIAAPLHEIEQRAVTELGPRGVTVIVAHGPDDKGLGLRIVQHELGSRLLSLAGVPVVATSANLHGQPPLNNPVAISQLPGVDAVLSVGELPPRPASVVVRMLRAGLQILRPGELKLGEMVWKFSRRLEFICMGNLNRSAFASALYMNMVRYYDSAYPDFLQAYGPMSTGLIANPSGQVPMFMKHVASIYGVDLSKHVPHRYEPNPHGVHIAMGPDIYEAVPHARRWNTIDPMGRQPDAYIQMAAQVRDQIQTLLCRTARVREADAALEDRFEVLFCGRGNPA